MSSDRTTLTFTPSSLLAVSTTYTVAVSGFTDQAGNSVTSFTSNFATGSSGVANTTTPSVASVSPTNGATAVAVNSTVVLTFNEAIDASTVNNTTVPISVAGVTGVLAGSYAVDATGTVVTFTPTSPLPGGATIYVQMYSGQVRDLSGNQATHSSVRLRLRPPLIRRRRR